MSNKTIVEKRGNTISRIFELEIVVMPRKDYSNLIGLKFGKLTVTGLSSKVQKERVRPIAICLCDCDNQKEVMVRDLIRKDGRGTQSCGCLNRELSRVRLKKATLPKGSRQVKSKGTRQEDGKHHPLFVKWVCMKQRCENPDHKSYPNYGGRGIKICDRWHDFQSFRDDCITSGWQPRLTIDRIDNLTG